jgi:hypothetical protein
MLICGFMNRFEQVVENSLKLYHAASNVERRLYYIAFAHEMLDQAINHRENGTVCHPAYEPSSDTLSELIAKRELLKLQERVANMCYTLDIDFTEQFDIIHNPRSAANIAAHCLFYNNAHILKEVVRRTAVPMPRIIERLVVLFTPSDSQAITTFLKKYMEAHPKEARVFGLTFLQALAGARCWRTMLEVIVLVEQDQVVRAQLFLEYDYLNEAIASAELLPDLLPLIAHRAALLGKLPVVKECVRSLSLNKSV